jgi:hypothetical protein
MNFIKHTALTKVSIQPPVSPQPPGRDYSGLMMGPGNCRDKRQRGGLGPGAVVLVQVPAMDLLDAEQIS